MIKLKKKCKIIKNLEEKFTHLYLNALSEEVKNEFDQKYKTGILINTKIKIYKSLKKIEMKLYKILMFFIELINLIFILKNYLSNKKNFSNLK